MTDLSSSREPFALPLEREALHHILPHRAPMLLIDRIIELTPGRDAVGLKHVTDEDCAGHFPDHPIFPGVHIAEAMAQVAAVAYLAGTKAAGTPVYLLGYDKLRFRRPVRPGDTLRIAVSVEMDRRRVATFRAEATVDGARVANGSLMATHARDAS